MCLPLFCQPPRSGYGHTNRENGASRIGVGTTLQMVRSALRGSADDNSQERPEMMYCGSLVNSSWLPSDLRLFTHSLFTNWHRDTIILNIRLPYPSGDQSAGDLCLPGYSANVRLSVDLGRNSAVLTPEPLNLWPIRSELCRTLSICPTLS